MADDGRGARVLGHAAIADRSTRGAAGDADAPGEAGLVWSRGGTLQVVFDFTIIRGKVLEIDPVADPEHLRELEVVVLCD